VPNTDIYSTITTFLIYKLDRLKSIPVESEGSEILHVFLHRFFTDKIIHKANLKFCHLKVLMRYKYIGNFNKKYATPKTSN